MRAMVLDEQADVSRKPLALREVDVPTPGRRQVRIRVDCCAVCRTDLHIVEGDLEPRRLPVVPGHQIVGTVDAIGEGCERFSEGDRIGAAWLGCTCESCGFCAGGRENLCYDAKFTGYDFDGGYAEYALAYEAFAYPLPEDAHAVDIAPLLCAGIIGYRAYRKANAPDAGRLALVGFGSSAHLLMQLLRTKNHRVFVVTRSEGHQRLAREMGAEWVGDDPTNLPEPMDATILFAPAGPLVPAMLEQTERGGVVAMAGIHMSPIPEMRYEQHLYHERELRSVMNNTRADGRDWLAEARNAGVTPRIERYDLADANRALQDMKESKIDGTAVLIIGDG